MDFLGGPVLQKVLPFELYRREPVGETVTPRRVVEELDVIEHVRASMAHVSTARLHAMLASLTDAELAVLPSRALSVEVERRRRSEEAQQEKEICRAFPLECAGVAHTSN